MPRKPRVLAFVPGLATLLDLPTRIAERVTIDALTGCYLWAGHTNKGHGRIAIGGVHHYTHVLAWEHVHGPVPDGMVLDHCRARGCSSRACCNVAHLEPVSSRENTLRGDGPSAANASRDACGRCGAPYTYQRDGTRRARECVVCRRERQRRHRQRRQAERMAAE